MNLSEWCIKPFIRKIELFVVILVLKKCVVSFRAVWLVNKSYGHKSLVLSCTPLWMFEKITCFLFHCFYHVWSKIKMDSKPLILSWNVSGNLAEWQDCLVFFFYTDSLHQICFCVKAPGSCKGNSPLDSSSHKIL